MTNCIYLPVWLLVLMGVFFGLGIWRQWIQIVKLRKVSKLADAALAAGPFPGGEPSDVEFR